MPSGTPKSPHRKPPTKMPTRTRKHKTHAHRNLILPSKFTLQARCAGRVDVVRLLLGRHADPGSGDCHGATPLHYATRLRDPALTSLLLSRGSPTDLLDSKGFSPLMWAAVGGATAHLRVLHHHKVPLDAPTPDGVTGGGSTACFLLCSLFGRI